MTRAKCRQWLDQLANTLDYETDAVELAIINEAIDCLKVCYKSDEIKEILENERDRVPGTISFTPNQVHELLKWRDIVSLID